MSEQVTRNWKEEYRLRTGSKAISPLNGYPYTDYVTWLENELNKFFSPSSPLAVGEKRARAKLYEYLTHRSDCHVYVVGTLNAKEGDCNCGLREIKDRSLELSPSSVVGEAEKKRRAMKPIQIIIDNKPFEHDFQFITGREIKEYVNAPARYSVWLKGRDGRNDIELRDNEQLDLSREGRKYFFTGPRTTTEGIKC